MRKLILFFIAVSLGLTMTSCLDEGSQNFSESSIVYIAMDQNLIYGKTLTGRVITSDKMQMMQPGTFKFFSYSWEESYGYTPFGEVNVYNVVPTGDVIDISKTYLQMVPVTEVTPNVYFKDIKRPVYDENGVYLDDYWLFEYSYMGKEGETPIVSFHKRSSTEQNPDPIEIDVRLAKTGTPKDGASEKLFTDVVAVDMAQLRHMYGGTSTSSTKDLRIKFWYYLDGRTELTESQTHIMKVKGN